MEGDLQDMHPGIFKKAAELWGWGLPFPSGVQGQSPGS